jgi:hypothetical protein
MAGLFQNNNIDNYSEILKEGKIEEFFNNFSDCVKNIGKYNPEINLKLDYWRNSSRELLDNLINLIPQSEIENFESTCFYLLFESDKLNVFFVDGNLDNLIWETLEFSSIGGLKLYIIRLGLEKDKDLIDSIIKKSLKRRSKVFSTTDKLFANKLIKEYNTFKISNGNNISYN